MAESRQELEDWQLLQNAVREPVRQIIAVEVDTDAHVREIISGLLALDTRRPHARLSFDIAATTPEQLLKRARDASRSWPDEEGLLLIL